jgi:hypothetical protein
MKTLDYALRDNGEGIWLRSRIIETGTSIIDRIALNK